MLLLLINTQCSRKCTGIKIIGTLMRLVSTTYGITKLCKQYRLHLIFTPKNNEKLVVVNLRFKIKLASVHFRQ